MEMDLEAMSREAGIRAIWLLYKRGAWGYLEDLGMERGLAAPALAAFEAENLIGARLTKRQCSTLARLVPGLEEARRELQHAYALKYYDEQARQGARRRKSAIPTGPQANEVKEKKVAGGELKTYHAEVVTASVVDSDKQAKDLAFELSEQVKLIGGRVVVGMGRGEQYAILILIIPETEPLPEVPGLEWREVRSRQVPAVQDQGIR